MTHPDEQQRLLDVLDAICLDSLEGLASEQLPEHGETSALFHELRGSLVTLVETVRVQREALRAADAMRERIRKEDGGADDWGRWFECAAYDDTRAAVGVSGEPTPE